MGRREMTTRLLRAVRHPLVTILGHPTGRLLLGRKGSTFDVEAVAAAAAENDTFLEINANPQRLDLGEDLVRQAAARGARFAIDPRRALSPRDTRYVARPVGRAAGGPRPVAGAQYPRHAGGHLRTSRPAAEKPNGRSRSPEHRATMTVEA